jgi:hypothetical protein
LRTGGSPLRALEYSLSRVYEHGIRVSSPFSCAAVRLRHPVITVLAIVETWRRERLRQRLLQRSGEWLGLPWHAYLPIRRGRKGSRTWLRARHARTDHHSDLTVGRRWPLPHRTAALRAASRSVPLTVRGRTGRWFGQDGGLCAVGLPGLRVAAARRAQGRAQMIRPAPATCGFRAGDEFAFVQLARC